MGDGVGEREGGKREPERLREIESGMGEGDRECGRGRERETERSAECSSSVVTVS